MVVLPFHLCFCPYRNHLHRNCFTSLMITQRRDFVNKRFAGKADFHFASDYIHLASGNAPRGPSLRRPFPPPKNSDGGHGGAWRGGPLSVLS